MKGIIVYDREVAAERQWYIGKYIECFVRRGHECRLVCTHEIDDVDKADFAIMRDINPGLSKSLEEKGIRVFNSSRLSAICNDKYATYRFVEEHQAGTFLPVIKEYEYSEEWDFPCVLKSIDGHGGTEVFWIESEAELQEVMKDRNPDRFILQKPCDTPGIDVRVYVIGGDIIAAMKRTGSQHGEIRERFRSNYCLGGSCEVYDIQADKEMLEYVQRITSILEPDFVGIDFIFHNGHPVFNEVEDVVGARMIYDHTDIDIVDLYVDYIVSCF